ncbi:MAG: serine hydrolase [Clostridia bacterium]|nr:serine hydrolase [Clostridia bacterium]
MKRTVSLLLAVLLLLALAVPAGAAEDDTLGSSIQDAATLALEYGQATSLQYAVWENGEITYSGHAGTFSKTENRALTADDLYGIGSVSKMYTAAAVMKLADEGKIDLDKSVAAYLPDFKMADARYKLITVRMLLNHSSGLMGSSLGSGFLFDDPADTAAAQLLDRLSTQALKDAPGAFSVYCNDGFTLAQLVVEAVSGKAFGDYLHEALLTPMGLTDTYVPADQFDSDRAARTYLGEDTRALPLETVSAVGTGGIYATASDLAAFGGQLYESGVLSKKSLDAMASPEYAKGVWPADAESQLSYGLGWDAVEFYPFACSDVQALVKGGDTQLYHAGLLVLPAYKLSVAVVSSGGLSTYNEAAAGRMALDVLKSKGVTVDETPRTLAASPTAAMPRELVSLSGYYTSSTLPCAVEVAADGTMKLTTVYGAQAYTYRADGTFRDEKGSEALKLITEKNGETYLWQKAYGNLPGLIQFPSSSYLYQKTTENPVSAEVQSAWEARNGKLYLALNERYTSQLYALSIPVAGVSTLGSAPGYMAFDQIADADRAIGVARIPGSAGRDWQNVTMSTDADGVEYLETMGTHYMDFTTLSPVYSGAGVCTIQAGGYARWYHTGAAAGKTMTVTLPEHGAFYVYNAQGLPVAGSLAWGDTSAVLPEGGYIVFAGDAGAQFALSIK